MECRELLSRWRSWIRPILIFLYTLILLVALPLMIVEFQHYDVQTHWQAWFIGGMFTLMALPISVWGILQHLIHYTQPVLQKHIIRILWMVPIYAGDAWFALRFKEAAIYLDTMRECYEAYVIYNFMAYLLAYLRMKYPTLEDHLATKIPVKHFMPFCCLPSWPMGKPMVEHCRHGVLQYTVIRPVTTIIALMCEWGGVYSEGDFKPASAWLWLTIINNISQVWAMYCLVEFYRATKEELAPLKPVAKFMCVKAVVFLSFWQQVLIALLAAVGVINDFSDFTKEDVATGLQDFCICIEMFLAAVAHYYSFSHKEYIDPTAEQVDCCSSFVQMWDVSDVGEDVYHHVRHVGSTVVRPLRPKSRGENERTPLLSDNNGSTQQLTSPVTNDFHASISTLASFTDSIATHSEYEDRRSLTASMVNYVEFGESTRLNTNMGEALSNAQRHSTNTTADQQDEYLPPDDTSEHLQHSPSKDHAEQLLDHPTEGDTDAATGILVEPDDDTQSAKTWHDRKTCDSGEMAAVGDLDPPGESEPRAGVQPVDPNDPDSPGESEPKADVQPGDPNDPVC